MLGLEVSNRISALLFCMQNIYQWFVASMCYVCKTGFQENHKDTTVVCPVMWTYDVCAFDTGTYYVL